MGKFKKLAAVVLSCCIVTSSLPAVFAAEGTETSVTFTPKASYVAELSSPATNILQGVIPTEEQAGAPKITISDIRGITATNDGTKWTYGATNTKTLPTSDKTPYISFMTDGEIKDEQNFGLSFMKNCIDNEGKTVTLDGSKMFADMLIDLGGYYNLKGISVNGGNGSDKNAGSYELYALTAFKLAEGKENCTDENCLIKYTNGDTNTVNNPRAQYFKINDDETVIARYVVMRILNPVSEYYKDYSHLTDAWKNLNNTYMMDVRLSEFTVYGNAATDEEVANIPSQVVLANESMEESITDKTRITDLTVKAYKAHKSHDGDDWEYREVSIAGETKGNSIYADDTFFTENRGFTYPFYHFNREDGATAKSDAQPNTYHHSIDEAYVDFVYDLGYQCDISKINILLGTKGGNYTLGRYQILVSDTFDATKRDNGTLIKDFINYNEKIQQNFEMLGGAVTARYVILRVIDPMAYTFTSNFDNGKVTLEKSVSVDRDYNAADDIRTSYHVDIRLSNFWVYGTYTNYVDKNTVTASTKIEGATVAAPTVDFEGVGNADTNGNYAAGDYILTAADAPDGYKFAGWYQGTDLKSSELTYKAENITSATAFVAKYESDVQKHTVTIKDPAGKEIGTWDVGDGEKLSENQLAAINTAIEELASEIYGYRILKEDGNYVFNNPIDGTITADITVILCYKRDDNVYTVKIYGTDNSLIATHRVLFDKAIDMSAYDGNLWKINGITVSTENNKNIYVTGNMDIYAQAEGSADAVSVIAQNKTEDNKAVVFGRTEIAETTKTVTETGIIVVREGTSEKMGTTADWYTFATAETTRNYAIIANVEGKADDFMVTYNLGTKGYTYKAKAYVKYSDGTVDYSAVITIN